LPHKKIGAAQIAASETPDTPTKKRKLRPFAPIGCASLCDVLNELSLFESDEPLVSQLQKKCEEKGYLEDEEDKTDGHDLEEERNHQKSTHSRA